MPRSPTRRLVLGLAAVFLFGPLVLYAVGVTDRAIENRSLSARPKLSQGWAMFDQATRYLVDRLPLRGSAVRANTYISEHVFHQTPRYGGVGVGGEQAATALPFGTPRQDLPAQVAPSAAPTSAVAVLRGRDGWLYPGDDTSKECHPTLPPTQNLARWAHLVRAIRGTGRRAFIFFMPDKSTIYPEYLPAFVPEAACAGANRRRFWYLLEHHPPAGLIGLRQAELALKAQVRPTLTYYRLDSHPNPIGELPLLRAILHSLGLHVRPGEIARVGDKRVSTDLTLLLGTPRTELAPDVAVARHGIGAIATAQVPLPSGQVATTYTLGSGPVPRLAGRTVVIGDSFANEIVQPVAQFVAHLSHVIWNYTQGDDLRVGLAGANTVMIEVVERYAAVYGPPDGEIDALAARLGAPPR